MIDKEKLKILVAEDNFLVIDMIKRSLKELGYQNIYEASNGKIAIEKANSLKPDIIFMDIEMPEVNGIEAMKTIQAQSPVPIIMLTAFENSKLIAEAADAGASAYLIKPLKKYLVEKAVATALIRHKDLMRSNSLNKKLEKELAKRKQVEKELHIKNERLSMLHKIIRHDLSNDFSVINSAVNIFKRRKEMKFIDEISKRVTSSLKTIKKYKEYESFIDSSSVLNEIEIVDVVNEIITKFSDIKFNIEGKCKVYADEALHSVFINLISNSINHGNSTSINILITSDEDNCKVTFMDNGSGIQEKIVDRIFEEGFHYGKSGNTGIGLHIVKNTIERFGGSIAVDVTHSVGTTFVITLRKVIKS